MAGCGWPARSLAGGGHYPFDAIAPAAHTDRMSRQSEQKGDWKLVARDVRPDSRRRVALGKALNELEDATFNVYQDERGRIVLDPQVSIPASEAWLYRNPKALASVRRGLKEAAEGKAKRVRSFARHAPKDDES
jgi:hypothetical protein